MSISEIKASLHAVIDSIDDERALGLYLELLLKEMKQGQTTFMLTEEQRLAVEQAISSLEKGKGTPHDTVMNRFRKKYPDIIK